MCSFLAWTVRMMCNIRVAEDMYKLSERMTFKSHFYKFAYLLE